MSQQQSQTEPRRPEGFPPPGGQPPPSASSRPPTPQRQGGNTLLLVVISVVALCLSCSVIGMAALAGYNDGVRAVEQQAVVTRQADLSRQCELAVADVAGGNTDLAGLRLHHIQATLGADCPAAAAELTRVFSVTATPTPTLTPTVTPTLAVTATPTQEPPTPTPSLNPESLYNQAQSAVITRDWTGAIDALDILRGLDSTYRTTEVNELLREALLELARVYLREPSGDRLAEGILLAQRAQTLGDIGDLGYEMYIAGRYLDALNAEGMECLLSVRAWEGVYGEAPAYRDVTARLANAYAACGDAYTYQTEYCPAEQYYTWSVQVQANTNVAARLNEARELCAQATPTPTPTGQAAPPEGEPTAAAQ